MNQPVKARLYIRIRFIDQLTQRCGVHSGSGFQLYMAHMLTAALQQACRIRQLCAMEKPYVYVSCECIDVAEWRIPHARNRTSVMHKLPKLVSTLSHDAKPLRSDRSQFTWLL